MSEEKQTIQESSGELELVYSHMPQNDQQQIEQVVREYEGDPAKGFWWNYTTSQVPQNPTPRVTAVAKDLPGNAEGLVWQNN